MSKPVVKKAVVLLFSLRLFFYLSVLSFLAIHPGIAISFDRIGILQWFVIVPLMSIFAFILGSRGQGAGIACAAIAGREKKLLIISIGFLFVLSISAGGFSRSFFQPFFAGVVSFVLSFFLFKEPAHIWRRWAKLSLLEPFFLVFICLRLLSFSRSAEDIAERVAGLTQFIFIWSLIVFLLHSVVIYFCLFPQSKTGAKKEGALFAMGAVIALVLTLVILPNDFISNSIIENLNDNSMPELIGEDSDRGMSRGEGGRERRSRRRNNTGRDPSLRGISEHDWHSRQNRERGRGGSGDNMQYMIKIVASKTEPVYMGDVFKGTLDSVNGFLITEDDPLNALGHQRLFSAWHNRDRIFDRGRTRMEVNSLSTLPNKFLPYYPSIVDPTILSENSGPLRYIHQVTSLIHIDNPLFLLIVPSRKLNVWEETSLAQYLDVPLFNEDLNLFNDWLEKAKFKWEENRHLFFENLHDNIDSNDTNYSNLGNDKLEPVNEHLETIMAILTGFAEYQYNLSLEEEAPIERIKEFLFEVKDGDCVEFSNSAALLGRIAGIPSRVVTGYLVSEELQTEAHLRGLMNLRRQIPYLQQFDFNELFMVTNLHGHSWVQFYIPHYGWLDFETTSFAIPPLPEGDFNNWDVVIPVLDDGTVISNLRKFPWRAVGRALIIMAGSALVLAYALRYGREIFLYHRAKHPGREGARALYLLLLAKLAADGKPIKPASKTASEYSELFYHEPHEPHEKVKKEYFKKFASIYSEIRWREFKDNIELNEKYELLKQEFKNILTTTKQKGFHRFIIRIINLRGLAYL